MTAQKKIQIATQITTKNDNLADKTDVNANET
jgi:hypothetical protein